MMIVSELLLVDLDAVVVLAKPFMPGLTQCVINVYACVDVCVKEKEVEMYLKGLSES